MHTKFLTAAHPCISICHCTDDANVMRVTHTQSVRAEVDTSSETMDVVRVGQKVRVLKRQSDKKGTYNSLTSDSAFCHNTITSVAGVEQLLILLEDFDESDGGAAAQTPKISSDGEIDAIYLATHKTGWVSTSDPYGSEAWLATTLPRWEPEPEQGDQDTDVASGIRWEYQVTNMDRTKSWVAYSAELTRKAEREYQALCSYRLGLQRKRRDMFYHVRQKTDREGYDMAELMGGGATSGLVSAGDLDESDACNDVTDDAQGLTIFIRLMKETVRDKDDGTVRHRAVRRVAPDPPKAEVPSQEQGLDADQTTGADAAGVDAAGMDNRAHFIVRETPTPLPMRI
eukprot:SAG31_NODE_1997_length_6694_cov_12.857056_5_plen_342_part_00